MRYIISLILSLLLVTAISAQETPEEIALARIEAARASNATSLDLVYLGLHEIPAEIGTLVNLETLNISSNSFRSLPPEIGNLTNLKTLFILSTRLESLPPEIGNLSNLEWFDLASNNLTSLPEEFAQLSNLKSLSLSGNNFTSLPAFLGEMPNLRTLNFSGNPLGLPESIRFGDFRAALDYSANPEWWYIKNYLKMAGAILGVIGLAVVASLVTRKRPEKAK